MKEIKPESFFEFTYATRSKVLNAYEDQSRLLTIPHFHILFFKAKPNKYILP